MRPSTALYALGIDEAVDAGHGFVATAGLELGRACAPLAVFDELAVEQSRSPHRESSAMPRPGRSRSTCARTAPSSWPSTTSAASPRSTARGSPGCTTQGSERRCQSSRHGPRSTPRTWPVSRSSTLALAVAHARTRVQFGRPLMALAPVQHLLADAAALAQGLELLAWEDASDPWPALVHAGEAGCRVCEVSHQVHGAVGYALEAPLHSFFRRAHAVRVFTDAMARSARGAHA